MAKFVGDNVLDAALEYIADRGDELVILTGQPTITEHIKENSGVGAGKGLGRIALTLITGGGDYVIQDGDTNGRKLTVTQQTGINIDVTGTATDVGIWNTATGEILLSTTLTSSQGVTSGNTATVNTFDDEIADAV